MPTVTNNQAIPYIRECEEFRNDGKTFRGEYKGTDYIVYSYQQEIARYDGQTWTLNGNKFSRVTTRHQTIVRRAVG